MSGIAYPPPTENLPIFDNSVFNVNQNVALTEAVANTLYLKFPTAQGTETFGDIFVNGNATLNCPVQVNSNLLHLTGTSSIQFPDNSIQTSAYTGTSGIANTVVVAPGGSGAMYLALTQGTSGNYPILTNTPQYNATTGVLSSSQFTGNLNGNSSTSSVSSQSTISSFTSNVDYYPTMSANQTGSNSLGTDGALRYNPSTNNLTSNTFTGSLIGNASSATTASSATSATSATTATTASVATTATVSNTANSALGNTYIPLLTSISGNLGLNTAVSNSPRYNAITGQFTAQVFVGNLSGSASDSNNAQNVSLTTGDDSSGNWFIPYSKTTNNDVNRLYIDNITTPLTYNPSVGTLSASIFSGSLSGNATSANSVQVNVGGAGTVKLALVAGSGGIYPVLANIPAYNTVSTAIECNNFSASVSISSPYYTSPSGGNSRWYSTDNTQYGQIYSDNSYFLKINPAYKLSLVMNSQAASNPGAVNPIYTQGCDIGWNYSGNGSTDFYNNAGLQPTTTHQAFSFWDASTALVQQAIAYIPRIQSAFSSTGLNIPTYDWVNGTVSAAISALPGDSAYLNAGTSLSNQIFTGWNTFSNLLTASNGITSLLGRNRGYNSGSYWLFINAPFTATVSPTVYYYFKPNALYNLTGDLTQFITTNYGANGYFQVLLSGVYMINFNFTLQNVASINTSSIGLNTGTDPNIPATGLIGGITYYTTQTNLIGSFQWIIPLNAGTNYGIFYQLNTASATTGTYSMAVNRIM